MAPFKSSLAKTAAKLLKIANQTDLSLRGDAQASRRIIPPATWATPGITVQQTVTYTGPATLSGPDYTTDLVEVICVGAGGMPGPGGDTTGGQGGFSVGRFTIPDTTGLLVAVGDHGRRGTPGPGIGGTSWTPTVGNGGSGDAAYSVSPSTYGGGGGGGLSGVFVGTSTPDVTQGNALIIAGGGGGGGYAAAPVKGGNGGGTTADAGDNGSGTGGDGGGGTQSAGGAGGASQPGIPGSAEDGSALHGGDNSAAPGTPDIAYGGGGGGAGYWGGGGGGGSTSSSGTNSGGGGGGSGYLNSSSPLYYPHPTIERLNVGMGLGTGYGTGLTPSPQGLGKDHPVISPYYPSGNVGPNSYGAPAQEPHADSRGAGLVVIRYYGLS
jgi:hypothetical protein